MPEKIIDVDGISEYKENYGSYGMYLIGTRITADYRDGLTTLAHVKLF